MKRKAKKHLERNAKLSGGLKGATEPLGVPFDSNQDSLLGCQSSVPCGHEPLDPDTNSLAVKPKSP